MPDKGRHHQRAGENEQFSRDLLVRSSHLDWAVVSLFYAALHLIDAYLANQGLHPASHAQRRKAVLGDPAISGAALPYHELRQRCDDARYNLLPVSNSLTRSLLQNEFTAIRGRVEPLL